MAELNAQNERRLQEANWRTIMSWREAEERQAEEKKMEAKRQFSALHGGTRVSSPRPVDAKVAAPPPPPPTHAPATAASPAEEEAPAAARAPAAAPRGRGGRDSPLLVA